MRMPSSYMNERFGDDPRRSRFTYRDLRLLSQSSVHSPLRVIALVDFDCFYAQCEIVRLGLPDDQPLGVQQFNHVIAINYPARAAGLKKVVTAIEAKQKCPNIVLQHVPTWREGDTTWAYRDDVHQHMDTDKSSLDYYRLQSRKAIEVVKKTLPGGIAQRIEKAGIDEVFLDLSAQVHGLLLERYPELTVTPDTLLDEFLPEMPTEVLEWDSDHVVGTHENEEELRVPEWDDVTLNIGAEIVRNLRAEIREHLRYTCSAGIAHNKVIAKLAAGHNKPNKQTVVRSSCISTFLSTYKVTKLRGLGGKLGAETVKAFSVEMIPDLLTFSLKEMQSKLGPDSGSWVYRVIRGIEHSEVVSRTIIKSMASAKTFTPKIKGLQQAEHWLRIFAADIMGRVEDQEGRRPKTIAVHHAMNGRFGPTRSKQAQIPLGSKLDVQCLFDLSRNILIDITREGSAWPCLLLTISVHDFFDTDTTSHSLTSFWNPKVSSTDKSEGEHRLALPPNSHETSFRSRKRTILDYHSKSSSTDQLRSHGKPDGQNDTTVKRQRGLESAESTAPEVSNAENDGNYCCPTCKRFIPASDVLEHLDWHVALDVQNQG